MLHGHACPDLVHVQQVGNQGDGLQVKVSSGSSSEGGGGGSIKWIRVQEWAPYHNAKYDIPQIMRVCRFAMTTLLLVAFLPTGCLVATSACCSRPPHTRRAVTPQKRRMVASRAGVQARGPVRLGRPADHVHHSPSFDFPPVLACTFRKRRVQPGGQMLGPVDEFVKAGTPKYSMPTVSMAMSYGRSWGV